MEFWTISGPLAKLRQMPSSLADSFDAYVRGAVEAEELGFHGFGAPEHHFTYDGFIGNPLQALAAAAAATTKIRLVTGAMLLPLYDPLDAAEQAATLDVLSNGRLTLGLGMGYRPMEFDGLGMEKRTRGARLTEGIDILRLATSQERFSFEGRHYQYHDVEIHPRSIQRPIDLWFCGGTSLRGARRAGAAGQSYWLANSPYDQTAALVKEYRSAAREAGVPDEQLRIAAFKDVFMGETVGDAEGLRQLMIEAFYKEHILGYGYLVDDDGNHVYNPPADDPMYRRFTDSLFCGTIEMVTEELKRYEALGIDCLFLSSPQRDLVSSRIFPEFR